MTMARPRDELVAACPVHGRSPFNERSLKALNAQKPRADPTDTS